MEILLLHPGGLGDIILSLPAIAVLRSKCSSARITFAANIDHLDAIASSYAERILSLAALPLHRIYSDESLPQDELCFWKSFDRIVSWTGALNPEFIRNFKAIHPNVSIAPWKPEPGESRHVSRLFADSLELGIPPDSELLPAHINPDAISLNEGRQWLDAHGWNDGESLAVLHPGAGSAMKRWPLERFIALAQHLAFEEKRKLLIVEGPAEPGLAKQIAKDLPASHVIRAESVSLNLLAAVMAHGGIFVGNDSGVAHLAAALSLKSVVLFGPAMPQHWAPLGPDVVVLRNADTCTGCIQGNHDHTCLSNVTLNDVVRALH